MYRESAPPDEPIELELDVPEAPGMATLGCAAASAMAGAAVLGSPEMALVAGTGVLGAIGQVMRARWHRGLIEAFRSFVGGRVHVDERSLTSLDGERRVRFSAEDAHARFERLDPARGITLSCHKTRDRLIRGPWSETLLTSWHAEVYGRCVNQVCFIGSPPQLGSDARASDVCLVRVRVLERGVEVLRATRHGRTTGDTWHLTLDDAQRQIEHELGAHAGPLRSGDRVAPAPVVQSPWV